MKKTVNISGNEAGSVTEVLPKGFTYFVRDGDMIKIGSSMRPKERISALQGAVARLLEVLAVVPMEVADEFETHRRFAHLRVRGEWFRAEVDLLQFIENIKAEPALSAEPPAPPTYDFSRPKVKLNPAKTISKLLKMRSAIGADTPAGHRISNIDEIRQNRVKAEGDPVRLAYLDANLSRQLRDLEATRRQS